MNQKPVNNQYAFSAEQLKELDERNALHDSGKAKYYSIAEMRKRVLSKRKK